MKQKTNPGSTHGITLSLLRLYHSIQQEHDAMSPSQEKNPMKQKENQMRYYLGEKYPNRTVVGIDTDDQKIAKAISSCKLSNVLIASEARSFESAST